MSRLARRVVLAALFAVLASGCASSSESRGSLVVSSSGAGRAAVFPAGEAPDEFSAAAEIPSTDVPGRVPVGGGESFTVAPSGDVPVEDMVVADTTGGGDGVLVLLSAGIESLTVRWAEAFAPDAASFRLQWRVRPADDSTELEWSSVDLAASVRTYEITGLTAGTRYRLRLTALDSDGGEGAFAVAGFETLAPPVRNLTGSAVAHDAVSLAWDGPAEWAPVGYVVQWRLRGPNPFLGRLELPPGRRSQIVEGLSGGVEYVFRVTARTAAGWQSKPAAIGVTTAAAPDTEMVLEVSVPAYCIADEGSPRGSQRIDPDTERIEDIYRRVDVASMPLQWRISGGKAPYTLRVLGTEHSGATGTTDVSCATAGLNLENLPSHETSVVEAGPKTLTIEATDATGDTTTKTATIEIIEAAHTASDALDGDYLQPGRTYSFFDLFIEIPEGARIAYVGAVEADDVYHVFTEPPDGSRWTEFRIIARSGDEAPPPFGRVVNRRDEHGTELSHYGEPFTDAENAFWDLFLANVRTTLFPEGDSRSEPPGPLVPSTGRAGRQAAVAAAQCSDDGTTLMDFTSGLWRPYGQLPGVSPTRHGLSCDRLVAVHPSLLVGEAITVCVQGGAMDDLLVPAIATATGDWNGKLAPDHDNPDPALRRGLGYAPFAFDTASPDCPTGTSLTDIDYIRVVDSRPCYIDTTTTKCGGGGSPATADTAKSADPPRIMRNTMTILVGAGGDHPAIEAELARLVRHELGHFLGLADYFAGCWRLVGAAATVQPSTMSYGQLIDSTTRAVLDQPDGTADPADCRYDHAVTSRDLEDVHALYHPLAVQALGLEESARAGRWRLHWRLPTLTPTTFNAAFLGVVRRELLAPDPVSGAPAGPAAWELFGLQVPTQELYVLPPAADVHGYEYAVVGLTRGDHQRGGADVGLRLRHRAVAMSGGRAWTAGSAFISVSATPTSVAVGAAAAPITEGASAVFAVSRTGATGSALTFDLLVTETGEMVAAGEEGSRSVTIPASESSVTFEVPTVGDSDIESDSVVTVSVTSGVGYGVVSPGSASVTVADDDLPLVAVAAAASPITEGDSAFFAVSRTGTTTSALPVDLNVSEVGGDRVASTDEGSRSVTIPAGDSSVAYTVATLNDSVVEVDSTITVSVTSGADYGVIPPGSAGVVVNDDDTAPAASVFLRALSSLPVTEGASLVFRLSRRFGDPVAAPLTVNLRVTELGDVVAAGDAGARSVMIAAGDRRATFSVATVDDSVAEGDSVVTVEVTGGTGYSFSPFSASESVAVYDNDDTPPTVAIRSATWAIHEGEFVEFTVIHTGVATSPVTVQLAVSETGDVLYSPKGSSRSFTIPAGANSATFRVGTRNDDEDDWLSVVTLAVASGTGYSVGSPGSASFIVLSDEVPGVSVVPVTSPVSEGTAAGFTVRHEFGPSTQPATVELRVGETGDMLSPMPLVSATIPAGDTSVTFEVPTVDDVDAEVDSVVTVVIESVDGDLSAVHPSSYGASASVVVHDDENTAPRVTISPPRFALTEGTSAGFTVSRSGATSSALTVALTVSETADMISGAVPTSVTIPAGETSATFDVPTDDDSVDEDDSVITVQLAGGAGYAVGTADSAIISVRDNDRALPRVSILRGTWDTIEGGTVSFTVSRAGPRGLPLRVALRVTETGDLLAAAVPTSVMIPAGEASATFEVSTDDDAVEEGGSIITVDIVSGAGYTVGTPGSASVPIYDNDAPPTIAVQPDFASTEARPARFIVSRAGSAASALTVELTVTETGDMIDPAHEGSTSVTIPAGAVSATFEVPTDDDDVDEDDSTVTATISPGAGYAIGVPNSASVTVYDNDDAPTVTIRPGVALATEGYAPRFIISRTGYWTSALVVDLTVTETGDMIGPDDEGPTSITIRARENSATLYVNTVDDTVAEDDSTVTATITTSTRYTTGRPGSASVTTRDDDGTPTVTIRSAPFFVTEGIAARITVRRSGPTTSPLTIELTATETGDMIDPSHEGPTSFTIPAGQISATFELPTVDDAIDEDNSTVRVTISDGGGLTIGSRNSEWFTVVDNDLPTITIQPETSPVTEGAFARFTVDRTGVTTFGLTVDLSVSETGDMIHTDDEDRTSVRFRAGETTATRDVATVDDTLAEDDSTITATIARNSRYTIGTPGSASVTASDNDLPVITIQPGTSPVIEGDTAGFTIDRTGPTTAALTVELTVSESDDMLAPDDEGSTSLTIPVGETSATFEVATVDDTLAEDDSTITATIATSTVYATGTPNSATVTANDDDTRPPTVTITAATSPIAEGDTAGFTIDRTGPTTAALTVELTVTESGDMLAPDDEGSASFMIPVGETSATFELATVDDTVAEDDSTITATITASADYAIGTPGSATVTADDNDP